MKTFNIGYVNGQQNFTQGIGYGFMNGERGKKCPVRCITTGKDFTSAGEAGREYGLFDGSKILRACKGKIEFAGKHPITKEKLYWEFN